MDFVWSYTIPELQFPHRALCGIFAGRRRTFLKLLELLRLIFDAPWSFRNLFLVVLFLESTFGFAGFKRNSYVGSRKFLERRTVVRHSTENVCRIFWRKSTAACVMTCRQLSVPQSHSIIYIVWFVDIGRILPLSYSKWRQSQQYNPYVGMRKHLFAESRPVDDYTYVIYTYVCRFSSRVSARVFGFAKPS